MLAETHTDASEHPTDLDSHADTCVVGKNALIIHILNKKVNVTGFDPSLGKVKDLDLVSAALAYDCPETGETVILMIHQAVHVPTMINDLLCPMQMRTNDIGVQECPKFLEEHPDDTSPINLLTTWLRHVGRQGLLSLIIELLPIATTKP